MRIDGVCNNVQKFIIDRVSCLFSLRELVYLLSTRSVSVNFFLKNNVNVWIQFSFIVFQLLFAFSRPIEGWRGKEGDSRIRTRYDEVNIGELKTSS